MSLRSAIAALLATGAILAAASPVEAQSEPTPIVIGQSYALPSAVLGATREINVWLPPGYAESGRSYPVLYLLDGGTTWQDFHHISGLAQLGTVNGTTRDIILIGIASVDRRNELALPTENPELIARYPTHGQSERFRRFIADEVQPFVGSRFRTNGETALMGESLAGLFVVETFLKEPQMFDAWVAVSPSLWWDGGRLAQQSGAHLRDHPRDAHHRRLATAPQWQPRRRELPRRPRRQSRRKHQRVDQGLRERRRQLHGHQRAHRTVHRVSAVTATR
jgi:predicted alpha/beta superfamily hydrolase